MSETRRGRVPRNVRVCSTKSFTNGRAPKTFFPPKTVTISARVQPVLTPDNYQPAILALIDSATTSFYMQTQYINPSGKPRDEDHDARIAAIGNWASVAFSSCRQTTSGASRSSHSSRFGRRPLMPFTL